MRILFKSLLSDILSKDVQYYLIHLLANTNHQRNINTTTNLIIGNRNSITSSHRDFCAIFVHIIL